MSNLPTEKHLNLVQALTQIPTVLVLLCCDLTINIATSVANSTVKLIDYISGSKHVLARKPWHKVRYSTVPVSVEGKDSMELDVEKTLAKSDFCISPDELVLLAKEVARTEFGCEKPELLAEDFQFVAPIVGPLSKKEFVKAFSDFKVKEAFPDQKANFYNFHVDPQEPNRVWFFTRAHSTHTGSLNFGGKIIKPTGIKIEHPPQALSLLFDEQRKAYTLTVGYVMDRRIGNTGGMGGLFGPLFAVGHSLPVKEGQPWTPSLRLQALERIQKAAAAFGFGV